MANDQQFKPGSKIVAVRGVGEYRQTIPELVSRRDQVLEVGCEWGTTTHVLAQHAGSVLGTDISRKCIDRARETNPGLSFELLDAFDVMAARELGTRFTKVYMDLSGLSGYRGLLDLIALIDVYSAVIQPDTLVVKSGALKHFVGRCTAWPSGQSARASCRSCSGSATSR